MVILGQMGCSSNSGQETTPTNRIPVLSNVSFYQNGFAAVNEQRTISSGTSSFREMSVNYVDNSTIKRISAENDGDNFIQAIYTYDEQGRISEFHIPDATLVKIKYDTQGAITSTTQESGDDVIETEYTYQGGLLVSKKSTNQFSAPRVINYLYDETGLLLKAEEVNAETQLPDNRVVEYVVTDGNRITTALEYIHADELRFVHSLSYDVDGNIIKYERYTADGSLVVSLSQTYGVTTDSNPNIIRFRAAINEWFLPALP